MFFVFNKERGGHERNKNFFTQRKNIARINGNITSNLHTRKNLQYEWRKARMYNIKNSKITCYLSYKRKGWKIMNLDTSILDTKTYKVRTLFKTFKRWWGESEHLKVLLIKKNF